MGPGCFSAYCRKGCSGFLLPDKYLVFGHTPTPYYTGARPEDARIYRKDMMIAIDCGCVSGGPLGCICLDTLEEIYV